MNRRFISLKTTEDSKLLVFIQQQSEVTHKLALKEDMGGFDLFHFVLEIGFVIMPVHITLLKCDH